MIAILERVFMDDGHALRQSYGDEVLAAGKQMVIDLLDPLRDGDVRHGAIGEGVAPDAGQACRQRDILQAFAIIEDPVFKYGHALRDGYTEQVNTGSKGRTANAFQVLREGDAEYSLAPVSLKF